ncbi:MAG: phosphopantothenoylcysteine decarboxylase [Candidatus Brocadiaceae bacterium]|nr:phosphopantothenoylcysteine decarboxylase [Candidatus Brocadiaceae bacterium]
MEPTSSNVILGVTGSIAAYKAAAVVRALTAQGHAVQVVMTASACRLVGPATFRALSGRPVLTEMFAEDAHASLPHISLAEWAHVLAIAPATANVLGKIANGLADDILTCTWMACDCPKVLAPAMNDRMWCSPAVERNCAYLQALEGVTFVGPVEGRLASGRTGMGHMASVQEVVAAVNAALRR